MDSNVFPLLHTKLHKPPVPAGSICRERLHELLGQGLELPLTVVTAPAGYGKSTLVSQWMETLGEPCAWLSLDVGDSDISVFLPYFLAALETLLPDPCPETRVLCTASNPVPIPVLGSSLANELDALEAPLVVVLDDYHRIDPTSDVHHLLRFLLDHPSSNLRLLLVSRTDPPLLIALLRGRGQVAELRLRELRFTSAECAEYLADATEVTVSDEALSNLMLQTEGWIVAMRLVALHLRQVDDPEVALHGLRGGVQLTSEYLLHEVIEGLPNLTQEWLLKTAVLDRFCPALCDAVVGTAAGSNQPAYDGAQFVETLKSGNLFTIPLDLQGYWFRYHHLFQDMLREQLAVRATPDEIASLHLLASEWFESEGFVDEALRHALASGDVNLTVEIVARHRHAVLDTDNWYLLLANWLAMIPDAVIQRHTELLMARAWIFMHSYMFEALFSLLDRVESIGADSVLPESLLGEVAFCRGCALFFIGQGAESLRHINQALKQIPVTHYEARAQCERFFVLSSQMVGQKRQAISYLDELLIHYDSPSQVRKTRLLVIYEFVDVIDADLAAAEVANGRLREVAERGAYAYTLAWCDHLQGLIHLQRGKWDAAQTYLERSVAQRFIHFKRAATDSIVGLMLVHQMCGREDEARSILQELREYVAMQDDPALWPLVSSAERRLSTMQGRAGPGKDMLESLELSAEPAMLWWLDVPSVTACRALIAAGTTKELASAEMLLEALIKMNEAHHNTFHLIQCLALQAVLLWKQDETEKALLVLERALTLAQPGGLVFPFLELGKPMADLLERLPHNNTISSLLEQLAAVRVGSADGVRKDIAQPVQTMNDLLTDRELQIIELLSQRLQYKEIAARLFISPQTVNSHLKNAYHKLGASNRREAVARALELGLLAST